MFEKKAIMIFKWNEILGYDECTEALLKSLEGKPVVIYVAGAKQKLGIARNPKHSPDGIFVDLVLGTTEKLALTMDLDGSVTFKEIYMDYPKAVKPEPEPEAKEDVSDLKGIMDLKKKEDDEDESYKDFIEGCMKEEGKSLKDCAAEYKEKYPDAEPAKS